MRDFEVGKREFNFKNSRLTDLNNNDMGERTEMSTNITDTLSSASEDFVAVLSCNYSGNSNAMHDILEQNGSNF